MKPASRLRVGLEKRLLAWSLDLAIVTLSLAVVLLCGGYYATGGLRAAGIIAFFKGEWLGGVSPWIILAGAYGVFLCYGLVFRLLVGATFGESLLGVGRHGRLMTRRIPKS